MPVMGDHVRAELLRLRIRARGELLSGDPGRKAQIVFDLRARTGLSTRRVRLQDQHVEPFRCPVDGRRKARRSGADDDQISNVCGVDRFVEAKAPRNLLIAGVPQCGGATADQDGHVFDADVETIQQLLDAGIANSFTRSVPGE